jgi:hypothetical protein
LPERLAAQALQEKRSEFRLQAAVFAEETSRLKKDGKVVWWAAA